MFKAGYVTKIWVKSNIKKGTGFFLLSFVCCQVNAEMKKQDYEVYVHLSQVTGDIVYAKCQCSGGASGHCKHVVAILFQLLDFCELELSQVPDEKYVLGNYNNGMLKKKFQTQNAVLFEDLIFPQDSYEKDKKGRKRPAVQGKRVEYTSLFEGVKN